MSRHFRLNSELSGAIAKKLPHAKNQLSAPGSFFNQFVTDIYIHINRVLIVRIIENILIFEVRIEKSREHAPYISTFFMFKKRFTDLNLLHESKILYLPSYHTEYHL